jgi:hypothetical protein
MDATPLDFFENSFSVLPHIAEINSSKPLGRLNLRGRNVKKATH